MDRFRSAYAPGVPEELPWYHEEPDADLVRLFGALLKAPSDVVDLGAGPTVHGLWLAGQGHRVRAVDGVADARAMALRLAEAKGVSLAGYEVADVLDWAPAGGESFDLVLDRGFLHTLDAGDRPRWRARVAALTRPGGFVVAKEFTVNPRGFGPKGLSAAELLEAVGEGEAFDLLSLDRSTFNLSGGDHVAGEHSTWTLVARRR